MKAKYKITISLLLFIWGSFIHSVEIGNPAPEFIVKSSQGKTVKLKDFYGKYLILEWHNNGCPYVQKHYDSNNMQNIIDKARANKFEWLTIISSSPGKQGFVTPQEANQYAKSKKANPTAILLDSDGKMGKAYSAKATPTMVIISPDSKILYYGAIDDKPTADSGDIPKSINYVKQAIEELISGKKISTTKTKPYGCSVKY